MGIENVDALKNNDEGSEATQDTSAAAPVDITPSQVEGNPTPTVPTTSPDVVVTNDPGPAPEGDTPDDDGSVSDNQDDDPASDDAVDPLADEENPGA